LITAALSTAGCQPEDPAALDGHDDEPVGSAEEALQALPVVTFQPASPSSQPLSAILVDGPASTLFTLYAGPSCTGAALASKVSDAQGHASFAAVAIQHNQLNRFSASAGGLCGYGAYRHDDIPPAPPVLTEVQIDPTQRIVRGATEPGARVRLYTNATCTLATSITIPARGGEFGVAANTLPATLYAKSFDEANNASACVGRTLPALPVTGDVPLRECPNLPVDVTPSRPPAYGAMTITGHFRTWYNSGCTAQGCPAGSPEELFQREMTEDRPAVYGLTGGSESLPFFWGLGAVRRKVCATDTDPDCVIGQDLPASLAEMQSAGQATVGQIQNRITALQQYHSVAQKHGLYLTYDDLGSQMYGDPGAHTLLWNFIDNWGTYQGPFGLGPAPIDFDPAGNPFGGWRAANWDHTAAPYANAPAALLGYSYNYGPGAAPPYRWTADILAPGWLDWRRGEVRNAALAGYPWLFIDNAGAPRCWGDRCETAFEQFAVNTLPAGSKLVDRAPSSLFYRGDCEEWSRGSLKPWDTNYPYQCLYVHDGTGSVKPTIDAHGGAYAADIRGTGAGANLFQYAPSLPLLPDTWHRLRFWYKHAAGTTLNLVQPFAASVVTSNQVASNTWQLFDQTFKSPPSPASSESLYLQLSIIGGAQVDDFLLEPLNGPPLQVYAECSEVAPGPQLAFNGKLSYAQEQYERDCSRHRNKVVHDFQDSVASQSITALRDAGRTCVGGACSPGFNIMVNSARAIDGAASNLIEYGTGDAFKVHDLVFPPGLYPSGAQLTSVLDQVTLPADTVLTNAFIWRHAAAMRSPAHFSRAMLKLAEARAIPPGGVPGDTSLFYENPATFELQLAQAAAFGGGVAVDPLLLIGSDGGRFPYCNNSSPANGACYAEPGARDAYRDPLRSFFDNFVNGHPSLYSCLRPHADVAVVIGHFYPYPGLQEAAEVARVFEGALAKGLTVDLMDGLKAAALSRYKIIVLHKVPELSESDARALAAFVATGGTVIATEHAGYLDERELRRDAYPSTFWSSGTPSPTPPPSRAWQLPDTTTDQQMVTAITQAMSTYYGYSTAVPSLPAAKAAKVRVAAWTDGTRTVVHLVNFDVRRGHSLANATSPIATPFEVRVRAQPGVPFPTTAHLYNPDSPFTSVTVPVVVAADGRASFTVPSLRIYAVAEL
jgi:hypothetical protein